MRNLKHQTSNFKARPGSAFQVSSLKSQVFVSGVIFLSLLFTACKNEEDNPPPPTGGYQYTAGDTVFTIPAGAVSFAQQNFSRDAQLLREFQIAITQGWQLPLNSWKQSGFDIRLQYMVAPYDNDVATTVDSLFYYEIGTYFAQFGYGWMDTFDAANFDPNIAYTNHLWSVSDDAIETVWFDGQSAFFEQYRGMWITE